MKKFINTLIILALGILIGALFIALGIKSTISSSNKEEFHEHANIAVYLNDEILNLSDSKYMHFSACGFLDKEHEDEIQESPIEKIHLHDNNGGVIHVHKEGLTYADFFEGINMELADTYFVDDEGVRYEDNSSKQLRFYLNGEEVQSVGTKEVRNLDKVLITYNDTSRSTESINNELLRVPNDACISSGVCSHRGRPVAENCGAEKDKSWLLKLLDIDLD